MSAGRRWCWTGPQVVASDEAGREDILCWNALQTAPAVSPRRESRPMRAVASRISDTRVRCVPAVSYRERALAVAHDNAERPVHDRALRCVAGRCEVR